MNWKCCSLSLLFLVLAGATAQPAPHRLLRDWILNGRVLRRILSLHPR